MNMEENLCNRLMLSYFQINKLDIAFVKYFQNCNGFGLNASHPKQSYFNFTCKQNSPKYITFDTQMIIRHD